MRQLMHVVGQRSITGKINPRPFVPLQPPLLPSGNKKMHHDNGSTLKHHHCLLSLRGKLEDGLWVSSYIVTDSCRKFERSCN